MTRQRALAEAIFEYALHLPSSIEQKGGVQHTMTNGILGERMLYAAVVRRAIQDLYYEEFRADVCEFFASDYFDTVAQYAGSEAIPLLKRILKDVQRRSRKKKRNSSKGLAGAEPRPPGQAAARSRALRRRRLRQNRIRVAVAMDPNPVEFAVQQTLFGGNSANF